MRALMILKPEDDVAVALRDLPEGPATLPDGGTLHLLQAIPLGHKVARRTMPQGHHIRKYGAAIGEATQMTGISRRAASFTESVIREMTRLAMAHDAVNLSPSVE